MGVYLKRERARKKLALLRLSWHTFFAGASQSFNLPDGARCNYAGP